MLFAFIRIDKGIVVYNRVEPQLPPKNAKSVEHSLNVRKRLGIDKLRPSVILAELTGIM